MATISFTSSSRLLKSLFVTLALLAIVNGLVALRLPVLLQDSFPGDFVKLDRQVQAFPHKHRTRLLLLGNSHVLAGFRVPQLARALGVSPDECFNLAVPACSPWELKLLLKRYLSQFPNASIAVLGVDPFFYSFTVDSRMRYLTRTSLAERWRYAAEQSDLDERLHLLVSWWLPVMDFSGVLSSQVAERPGLMAQRLWSEAPRVTAGTEILKVRPYPWGYPPVWDYLTREEMRRAHLKQRADEVIKRTEALLGDKAEGQIVRSQHQLHDSRTILSEAGIALTMVEVPLEERMVMVMQRGPFAPRYVAYERALAASGPVLRPAANGWSRTWFTDADHLTPAGAARLSTWLAPYLKISPGKR